MRRKNKKKKEEIDFSRQHALPFTFTLGSTLFIQNQNHFVVRRFTKIQVDRQAVYIYVYVTNYEEVCESFWKNTKGAVKQSGLNKKSKYRKCKQYKKTY